MGITALYPKPKTTIANKELLKYPYLLKRFKNDKNQVVINKPNFMKYTSRESTIRDSTPVICYYM